MNDQFLSHLLDGNNKNLEKEERDMKVAKFVKVLQNYFSKVVKTYYTTSDGKLRRNYEGNQARFLFQNLMVNVSAKKFEILDRVKLLEPKELLTKGLTPDIIFYSQETKEV